MTAKIAVSGILILLLAAAFLLSVRDNRAGKKRILRTLRANWGKEPKPGLSAEERRSVAAYFIGERQSAAEFTVDDTTWNDCDLEGIFAQMNGCISSPGDSVLYSWLREPVFSEEELRKRTEMADRFAQDPALREKVQLILAGCGRLRNASFYEYISGLRNAAPIGRWKYMLLGGATLAALLLLFFFPAPALAVLLLLLTVNTAVYLKQKDRTRTCLFGFQAILRMIRTAEELSALRGLPEDRVCAMKEAASALASFRRGSSLVTESSAVGTGLSRMLLEYFKMFFHPDLIKYDQMLSAFRGQERACVTLLEEIGALDAAAALASFRVRIGTWCHASFRKDNELRLRARGLRHLMIRRDPVPNDCDFTGGNLITGSNASGKSTFLKSLAVAAVLAQAADTVPADFYEAPFMRVYTSMALKDSLETGESYFVVEIRSLKRILDAASLSGTPVLGIVDEVLRGTNTIERIAASSRILSTLRRSNVLAFAATHDLELTSILSERYANWHFGEEICGNDIHFTFRLLPGPAVSRNAIRLLASAGYAPEIVASARNAAAAFESTGEWEKMEAI